MTLGGLKELRSEKLRAEFSFPMLGGLCRGEGRLTQANQFGYCGTLDFPMLGYERESKERSLGSFRTLLAVVVAACLFSKTPTGPPDPQSPKTPPATKTKFQKP